MRGLPAISSAEAFRVRRWDALVLGGALPGLVAAARLGQRGLRVLVVEEDVPGDFPGAREPFLLVDGESHGMLAECLRALGVPLIDQRRFVGEDVALQVCDAEARIDLGRGTHTVEEMESWGLAERREARAWVDALDDAAEAERSALFDTTLVLSARVKAREVLSGGRRSAAAPPAARGWPAPLRAAPAPVRALFDAPVRALSNLGASAPSAEAKARLVGGLLRGAVAVSGVEGVRALLRRRVQSLYGEFRPVGGAFQLVSVAGQPGLAVAGTKEIWTGRALVLNAPTAAVAAASEGPVPDLLRAPPVRRRRHTLRFQGPRELVSPCMADRVIWREGDPDESVALRLLRGRRREDRFDLLASVVVPTDDAEAPPRAEGRIERALRDLLPFSEGALERKPLPTPRWDTDALLPDPTRGAWPEEPDLRLSSRPPVYGLERAPVGGLGGEGDLWLGWRAGDAIAEQLG